MKTNPKLIILSDLWGEEQSGWIAHYTEQLKSHFAITYYDCCKLGELDKSDYTEQNLHTQFVKGGVEKAVANLIEKEQNELTILAFSIGGYIGWQASLQGLKAQTLFAVSSTRLRNETKKPRCHLELFFGEEDPYKPKKSWFEKMNIEMQMIQNEKHNFYRKREFAIGLSKRIIEAIKVD